MIIPQETEKLNIPDNVKIPGKLFMLLYEHFNGVNLTQEEYDYMTATLEEKANRILAHCNYSQKILDSKDKQTPA